MELYHYEDEAIKTEILIKSKVNDFPKHKNCF